MPDLAFDHPAELHLNPARKAQYGPAQSAVLSEDGFAAAVAEIERWEGYAPTPVVELPGLARAAGIGWLGLKDESRRFGLLSFKALGGAYAVERLLAREIGARMGREVTLDEVRARRHPEIAAEITVCCATDGNHGRSVAWGAARFGCRCRIYVHETVSPGRAHAIAAFGAVVVRRGRTYDEAVRAVAEDAARNGWRVVSDTSYPGYMEIPKDVMHGYGVMAEEAIRQQPHVPTHVLIQGGVGGVAAAVLARYWQRFGAERPRCVVVEPSAAACILESARAGRPTVFPGDLETIMAGLGCGEVSPLAWTILEPGADAFMAVSDEAAVHVMRLLAEGALDPPLVVGESGVAGLAGLLAALAAPDQARALGLGPDSRVLAFATEGATDRETYTRLVGRRPEEVARRAS
jgi:diaminopropionate ammonia-lyase